MKTQHLLGVNQNFKLNKIHVSYNFGNFRKFWIFPRLVLQQTTQKNHNVKITCICEEYNVHASNIRRVAVFGYSHTLVRTQDKISTSYAQSCCTLLQHTIHRNYTPIFIVPETILALVCIFVSSVSNTIFFIHHLLKQFLTIST